MTDGFAPIVTIVLALSLAFLAGQHTVRFRVRKYCAERLRFIDDDNRYSQGRRDAFEALASDLVERRIHFSLTRGFQFSIKSEGEL